MPSRASAAKSFTSAEIADSDFSFAPVTTGVMRPVGVDTATEMSARVKLMSWSGVNITLHAGTSINAAASAFTNRSLTDSLTPRLARPAFRSARSFSSASSRTSTVR